MGIKEITSIIDKITPKINKITSIINKATAKINKISVTLIDIGFVLFVIMWLFTDYIVVNASKIETLIIALLVGCFIQLQYIRDKEEK